nr:hypothetical protein [Tanacetum cinerariifolium]
MAVASDVSGGDGEEMKMVRAARDGEWGEGTSRSGDGDRFWVRRKRSPKKFSGGGGLWPAAA